MIYFRSYWLCLFINVGLISTSLGQNELLNTYQSTLSSNYLNSKQINWTEENKKELLNQIGKANDNELVEKNWITYAAHEFDATYINSLYRAKNLNPNDVQTNKFLAMHHFIYQSNDSLKIYLGKIDKNYSPLSKEYVKDVLNSVQRNGTLITYSMEDFLPIIYMQRIEGIRTDVTLIPLPALSSKFYQTALEMKQFLLPKEQTINANYLQNFLMKNTEKNIHLTQTIDRDFFSGMEKNLFVLGTVLKYSQTTFENTQLNDHLYRKTLNLKAIKEASSYDDKQLGRYYIAFLVNLYYAYAFDGNSLLKKQVSEQIQHIGNNIEKVNIKEVLHIE